MPNNREQQNDNAAGPRGDDDLELSRTVFLRHAAFSSPDSLARDTIRRYASFLGKTAGPTIARWSASGEGWGNWLNLEWLKGASPVRRRATGKVAKQAATARSVSVPTAENEGLTATAPEWAFADRVEGSSTPAPLEPESPVSSRLAIAGVPGASILTTAGGAGPSVHRAHTGIETDRPRAGLPASGDDRKPHPAAEHQGQQERETFPEPACIEPSASFTSTPAITGGNPGGHPTILSTVTERGAAKTFYGPPIFQRSHVRRVRAAEGHAGSPENLVSASAGRPGLSGRTDHDTKFAKQQAIQAEQDASPMLNKSTGAVGAASPVEPVLLQPSALASAKVPKSFDAQQALHRSYSQPDSAESIISDSAAEASPVGTRAGWKTDFATSSADPPRELSGPVRNSDAAPVAGSVLIRSGNTTSLRAATMVQLHPGRATRAQSVAATGAASSPTVPPEKSTLSGIPKDDSSSHAQTAAPEAVSGGHNQDSSAVWAAGESTYAFVQARRAAALYAPEVQRFGERLLQRHRDVLIAAAGAGSRTGSAASDPVVLATAPAQQPVAGAPIALSAPSVGNQSSNENATVLQTAARDPERTASDSDFVTPDSRVESPSPHSAGHPAVMAEGTLEASRTADMVFAEHSSPEFTTGNPVGVGFAGARNEPPARDHLGSTVARTGQASPMSSTGFEAAPMVSRISLKTGAAPFPAPPSKCSGPRYTVRFNPASRAQPTSMRAHQARPRSLRLRQSRQVEIPETRVSPELEANHLPAIIWDRRL